MVDGRSRGAGRGSFGSTTGDSSRGAAWSGPAAAEGEEKGRCREKGAGGVGGVGAGLLAAGGEGRRLFLRRSGGMGALGSLDCRRVLLLREWPVAGCMARWLVRGPRYTPLWGEVCCEEGDERSTAVGGPSPATAVVRAGDR
jgi:hypothetical protein